MAYYEIKANSSEEFLHMLQNRNDELVTAMVEGVLSAIDDGLSKIDLVEVRDSNSRFNKSSFVISIVEEDYSTMLTSCMDDMIRLENYELCSKIKTYLSSLETVSPKKKAKAKSQLR